MTPEVRLVRLPLEALDALVAGDLAAASRLAGVELTPYILEHRWLWQIRAVEVAYSVDPVYRRRGYANAMLTAAIAWASADPAVRTVRASISPDNAASLATLRPFGFAHVGEQWDEEDGVELLFELPVDRS